MNKSLKIKEDELRERKRGERNWRKKRGRMRIEL